MAQYAQLGSTKDLGHGVTGLEVLAVFCFFDSGGDEPIQQQEPADEAKAITVIQEWLAQFPQDAIPGWKGSTWAKTVEDGSSRFNSARVGGIYDPGRDAFIAAPTDKTFVFDEKTCRWYKGPG